MIIDRASDVQCCVCGRGSRGYGWHPPGTDELFKACSGECAELLPRMAMMAKDLEKFERIALDEAGTAAGCYLDQIGKTDLAALDREEWKKFLETLLTTFGQNLKSTIRNCERAPF